MKFEVDPPGQPRVSLGPWGSVVDPECIFVTTEACWPLDVLTVFNASVTNATNTQGRTDVKVEIVL